MIPVERIDTAFDLFGVFILLFAIVFLIKLKKIIFPNADIKSMTLPQRFREEMINHVIAQKYENILNKISEIINHERQVLLHSVVKKDTRVFAENNDFDSFDKQSETFIEDEDNQLYAQQGSNKYKEVAKYVKLGLSANDIYKRIKMPMSEIQLIINFSNYRSCKVDPVKM